MTASLGNFQNGAYGSNLDGFVYPQFLFNPFRPPTTSDIFPAGTGWLDNSASPKVIYITSGGGIWYAQAGGGQSLNSLTVTGPSTLTGTTNINTTGSGVTSIGTGGTGAVNIGNATGNTAITGNETVTGNITTSAGNVVINGAAKQLQVHGGAVTDFIGTSTLVAGTVTIANTNIAAGDRIFLSRTAANASTTLGEFSYTISAATSFTVTSLILGTPGSPQTGDLSSFTYFIVRQV